jgi:hypothetical protein
MGDAKSGNRDAGKHLLLCTLGLPDNGCFASTLSRHAPSLSGFGAHPTVAVGGGIGYVVRSSGSIGDVNQTRITGPASISTNRIFDRYKQLPFTCTSSLLGIVIRG